MKTLTIDSVLDTYLDAYRDLIVIERSNNDVVLSFPFHLAANHRIEITVSDWGNGRWIISDSARTLGEIQAAGYSLTPQMKEKLEKLASVYGLRIVDSHLVLESSQDELGSSIQKFLEVCKTVGDVYLVHKHRELTGDDLVSEIGTILQSNGMHYTVHEKIPGEIELHPFDLVVPSNGRAGVAIGVLSGHNTHNVAQIWGYKCEDIKRGEWHRKSNSKLALIYDVRYHKWSDASKAILESRADVALSSDAIGDLIPRL